MPVNETVVVRNTLNGIVVLGSEANAHQTVEWAACGDVDGEDVQFVSADLANSPGFRRNVAKGVLVIEASESDPGVVAALDKQIAAYKKREAGRVEAADSALERTDNRDVVSLFCVGPNTRDNGECGEPVAVPDKRKNDLAPLCRKHEQLRSEYIPQEVAAPDGLKSTKWVRTAVSRTPLPDQQ